MRKPGASPQESDSPKIRPALKGRHNTICSAPSGLPRFVILNPGRCPGLAYPALSGLNAHEETQRLATIDQRKLAALDDLKYRTIPEKQYAKSHSTL